MKVLVAKEPGIAKYTQEYAKPVPEDDQVVCKVVRNGICATDMAILSGKATFMHDGSTSYPVRFGHEWAGTVVEVGKNVKGFKVGDKAISEGGVSCGKCKECLRGNYSKCLNSRSVGTINTWPGSYAEYVVFPERHLFKIPEKISYDNAALMEPASVAMVGVQRAHIIPGESVVMVTGVGAIGIAAARFAKYVGAKEVYISGRTPYKLEVAKKMGVDGTHNPKEESIQDFVKRVTNGYGVDCAIECSGKISVLNDCVDILGKHGTLSVVAFYEQLFSTFDIDKFVMKECVLEPVMGGAQQDVINAVANGVDLTPLITKHIKFDDCGEFMTSMLDAPSKADIKVMVDFD